MAERRGRTADGLALGGGALLVLSAFLHWVGDGPGRSLRGHDLVDTLVRLGDRVPGLSSARLTVLWYLVPALGALTWVAVGLTPDSARGRTFVRSVAAVACVVTVATVAAVARLAGFGDLGAGAATAAVGACALLAAVVAGGARGA